MPLGSGALAKEGIIALQCLGVEAIAVDRYPHALGHQVAHHARTVVMSDPALLRVVPTTRASRPTKAREGMRRLAAQTPGLPTSPCQLCEFH